MASWLFQAYCFIQLTMLTFNLVVSRCYDNIFRQKQLQPSISLDDAKAETVVEVSVAEAKKELVDEMHRMNEALKDRGEAIAKLQDCLAETESKAEALNKKNVELAEEQNKLKSELKSKEEKLSSNETVVKDLEMELSRLRELKEPTHESDVLSTSTISRTEDQMRFKEVDDSIEEKYLKLRHVAVRLKKRVSELTQALEQEKNKSTDKSEILEKMQHLTSAAKNAQKVQESYDKTLDELEETKKQNSAMAASLKEMKGTVEGLKRQVTSLESSNANIPLMHKQVESLNFTIKELKNELNKLEMEKKVEVMKYEETKKQCVTLESKVESLSQSLDQAVQQGRTNNVLELEMKNYEKVIADLTAQLNSEKQKLANAEKECVSISLVKSGLEEQIALLDKQVKAEESRNSNLQDQLTSMRENSNSCQRQTEELNSQMLDLKRELQHARNIGEQQALEMSSLTSEFSRKEMDLQIKIDSFSSHIQSLETSLATIKQELLTSNSEKEHLREEFESYRLRAQSTLARQKGDSVSQGEKEAREQFDKLKKELDGAREKMENNQTEIETMNNKLSSLQLEKARSDKRYEDMTKALHQKITDYDTLNTEYRAFKFSAETLLQNTKIEFEETERSLKEEIETLKDLVNSLNEKVSLEMKEVSQELENKISGGSNFFEALQPHENMPSLQEREDGEGSESVPPPMNNFRRLSNLVPLDILLNNPIDDENRIPVLQEQIEKLHSELNSYEVRVKHLASLLSEAEKDSARSSQQNAVLKEELRRLERSLQREPHIANSEYLKNVIFKFLVLQNGDERTRLVPVLDTILKLSPEETSRLTAVARGESSSSWGSYLHSWTGL
uniref:GRIP and coiled-coil domain-containing protein 2 n=1 Tax=Lygus hesperus TaxID=30085 RepID=A0A0A9YCF3_LYGHE